jgi:hypothetical protein
MAYAKTSDDPEHHGDHPAELPASFLGVKSRTLSFGGSRLIVLTAAGEKSLSPAAIMVLLSANLLRVLLNAAKSFRPPRPGRRAKRRLDIRV